MTSTLSLAPLYYANTRQPVGKHVPPVRWHWSRLCKKRASPPGGTHVLWDCRMWAFAVVSPQIDSFSKVQHGQGPTGLLKTLGFVFLFLSGGFWWWFLVAAAAAVCVC